ncbi:MAG: phage portal protein, partial [Planctomycetia bacterium]|nr:phage portal protein [Planctomycetia bacterium]
MKRWFGGERRSLSLNDPALQALYGSGAATLAGQLVSVQTAVGLSAVWACVSLIAGTIASLPLILYRRTDNGRERAVDHPLFDVLHARPNPAQSVVGFWEATLVALLLRGNAFASVTRDSDGKVRALWFLHPDRVSIEVTKTGKLSYKVSGGGVSTTTLDASSVLHVCGPMSDNGYTGRSVISTFRETLGLAIATERFGSAFFGNGAWPGMVLKHPGRLTKEAKERLASSYSAFHQGAEKAHRTLVLEEGMTSDKLTIPPDDAQFLETRQFQVEEIARIFGVPPHMIGSSTQGSTTYSNSELESLRLLKHT